ncbi:MAG: SCO family protein [Gammaproteobacteria bacterium]|nr:SCO family protein [Gammaproteobacteria bacterium]
MFGLTLILHATEGLTIFTTEGHRRQDVESNPRPVPEITFIDQSNTALSISYFKGKTILMEFFFTSCPSYCYAMGSQFKKLQTHIMQSGIKNVVLMSVSFDYKNDANKQIQTYSKRFNAQKPFWYVVRAKNNDELNQLIKTFEVIIVGNEQSGYEHDSAVHLISSQSELYKIIDFTDDEGIRNVF